MAKNNRNYSRQRSIKTVGHLYRKKFRWVNSCIYCGENFEEWDHVLPISICSMIDLNHLKRRHNFHQGLCLVPSCKQCNLLANDRGFVSILEKRKYIQTKLRRKYLKRVRTIIWDDDEIKELGKNMRQEVENMMYIRSRLERRIYYPALRKI